MANDHDKIDFSHSNTDLMASVAVIFLLLAVAMILANNESMSRAETVQGKLNQERNEFAREIRELLNLPPGENVLSDDGCVHFIDDEKKSELRIRFLDGVSKTGSRCKGLTFDTADFRLAGAGTADDVLTKLALISNKVVDRNFKVARKNVCPGDEGSEGVEFPIFRISIEGHTDEARYVNRALSRCEYNDEHLCGNLYLSAQRAREVYLWISRKMAGSFEMSKNRKCFERLAMISGRGPLDKATILREDRVGKVGHSSKQSMRRSQRRVEYIIHFNIAKLETQHGT